MNSDPWTRISLAQGDITKLAVDVIVNAANERLAGGGGVDGAIHRAAGWPQMAAACKKLGGCATGDAKITPGFALSAKYVIHAVGPIFRGGNAGEAELLSSCYRKSLQLAADHSLGSIAFPAISTGVYGYPFKAATLVAFEAVVCKLKNLMSIEHAIFIYFSEEDFQAAKDVRTLLANGVKQSVEKVRT